MVAAFTGSGTVSIVQDPYTKDTSVIKMIQRAARYVLQDYKPV